MVPPEAPFGHDFSAIGQLVTDVQRRRWGQAERHGQPE
jgi:hypothetical protein